MPNSTNSAHTQELSVRDAEIFSKIESLVDISHALPEKYSKHFAATEVPAALIMPFGKSFGFSKDGDGNITGLKFGGLSENSKEILSLITKLSHLERLVFYSNEKIELPEELAKLDSLKLLWIGGKIKSIPRAFFEKETPLKVSTKEEVIEDLIPSELLEKLAKKRRPIRNRKDEATDEREHGKSILRYAAEVDFLQSNYYSELSEKLLEIQGIYITAKEVSDPPIEIINKGRKALETYYLERDKKSLPLNEVKVILVGNGGAGKTSLVKRIIGEKFNSKEPQTHGINIKKSAFPIEPSVEAKVNFWDFGGQEIMHATHQFFLSKRSIYLLVLDGRKDEDPEYWLQHIESFGGDSPVFVILNKVDEHPAFDVNRRFLQQKYPNIVDFFRVSCSKDIGIDPLKIRISEKIPETPMFSSTWPSSWFNAKRELESKGTEFVTLDEYKKICLKHKIDTTENQELLVDFLHDLGVILHFKDMHLLDTHVLNPRWVTEGVYKIINSEEVAKNHGVLHLCDLDKHLSCKKKGSFIYPREKHSFLIDLMVKFELCYKINETTVLIPDLLDIQEPPLSFASDNSLHFVFEYSYLPKSVMIRLIVRLHEDIKDNTKWRTGLLLKSETFNAEALIRADSKASRIYISVTGDQKRDFFSTIRKLVWDITKSFEKLKLTEFVPLPDYPEELVDYRELLGYERAGKPTIFFGRIDREFDVAKLLNGVEAPATRALNNITINGDYYESQQVTNNLITPPSSTQPEMEYHAAPWEKALAYISAIGFLALTGFLLIRNEPFADENLATSLRIFNSLIVAILGATIPGLLKIEIKSAKGITIRAAGALALFVLTYMFTPELPQNMPEQPTQEMQGDTEKLVQ